MTGARCLHIGNRHSSPKKGTKRRTILLMLLRRQGATRPELDAVCGRAAVATELVALPRDYGYDIRSFPGDVPTTAKRGPQYYRVYRLVGKDLPGSGYRSFLGDKDLNVEDNKASRGATQ